MAAQVLRTATRDNQRVVIIEAGDQQYKVAIKPAVDFNRQVIGYVAWLQHNGWVYPSEDEAVAAVCIWVDVMEGLASPAALGTTAPAIDGQSHALALEAEV